MVSLDDAILREYLREDLGRGDVTSEALLAPDAWAEGGVVARGAGVLAGGAEACRLFELAGATARARLTEGEEFAPARTVLEVSGPARAVLGAERVALNLLAHLSGIATSTRRAVAAVRGTGARIAATRKTLPGLRAPAKRAVAAGGGDPHRFDLGDAVLIKDNHLRLVGSVGEAVARARCAASFVHRIEVEVEEVAQAVEAARAGAEILLLDNMTPERVRATVAELERQGLRDGVVIEASGGITPETARGYAQAGADVISIGGLTLSAPAVDFSLEVEICERPEMRPQLLENEV